MTARLLVCLLALSAQAARAETRLSPDYLFNSDPTARVIDGRLYIFACHDQATVQFQGPEDFWNNIMDYQAYSTTDLKTWVHHGTLFSIFDAPWASGHAVWDGDAGVPANGRYYAYASFRTDRAFEIGVLEAARPEGPYRDALGKPLITAQWLADQGISWEGEKGDPCLSSYVFSDDKGQRWLLFGQFRVFLVPLSEDMKSFSGPVRELDIPRKAGSATEYIEGPMLNQLNGRWYFSYMTYKDWDGKNTNFAADDPAGPYIQYCVSDSMFGPFTNPRHLLYPSRPDDCNYAHTFVEFEGRQLLVYHVPYRDKQHRQLAVTELKIRPDGSIEPIHAGRDPGVTPQSDVRLLLDAYAAKRQAIEFHERLGADEERGRKQDFHLKLKAGGHLLFRNVDFGTGAKAFKVAISSENSKLKDARLEFRIGSPTGRKIAETEPIGFTFWITYYREFTGPVQDVTGVHDLYLVAAGSGGDAQGRLFNVNSFTFVPR